MAYLKPIQHKNYIGQKTLGTKDQPHVVALPDTYKVALYMGYTLKWDYEFDIQENWSPTTYKTTRTESYSLVPIFKKSYERFDFHFGYLSNISWIYETLLPVMQNKGDFTQEIKDAMLSLDGKQFTKEIIDRINSVVKDLKIPFIPNKNARAFSYEYFTKNDDDDLE